MAKLKILQVVITTTTLFVLVLDVTVAQMATAFWQSSSKQVYEGTGYVELPCLLVNFVTSNAVTITRNGDELTPRLNLNTPQTLKIPDSRYEISISNVTSIGHTGIWYYLRIYDVSRVDDGRYECQLLTNAQIDAEVIATSQVVLDVYYLPNGPPICAPGKVSVLAGNNITAMCYSQTGKPWVSLEWRYRGLFNFSGTTTRQNETFSSELKISSNLTGSYTCFVSFNATVFPDEEPRSCQAGPITIISNALLLVSPAKLTVLAGENADFTCNIAGDPIAKRMWYSEHIPNDTLFTSGVDSRHLFIQSVQSGYSGNITCRVVTGPSSYVEDSAQLIVQISTPSSIQTTTDAMLLKSTFIYPTEQSAGPSQIGLIGIVVGIAGLLVLVIIAVILIVKSRRGNISSNRELQSTSTKKENLSGPVVYADLDLTDMPTGTEVRPLTEEPTVYASVTPQKVENAYV